MTRTFIALELADSLQSFLRGIIHQLALELPSLRWVDPAGIHLTLAFLGDLSDEQLKQAQQAAEGAAQQVSPFTLRLSHLGTFGTPRQPRVLWIGIDESSGRLLQLHAALNRELEQRGFAIEKRLFSPHLTLSRMKDPLQPGEQIRLQQIKTETQFIASSPAQHSNALSVMKSELSRTGATYTCLRSCALGSHRAI